MGEFNQTYQSGGTQRMAVVQPSAAAKAARRGGQKDSDDIEF